MNRFSKIKEYYSEQKQLFDEVSEHSGLYNLGWAGKGFNGDFADAQMSMVDLVFKQLNLSKSAKILDIGCGQGGPARFISSKFDVDVFGMDILFEQVTAGNIHSSFENNTSTRFIQGNSEKIPFNENSFDGVYSIESAFHYHDKSAFIAEAYRVLKAGGRLAVADIVMLDGYENHWTHSGFKRALAAPELFTDKKYYSAAVAAGLKPLHAYDITHGVMCSLQYAAAKLFPRISGMVRSGYPLSFLIIVMSAFLHLRYTHPLIPARYKLYVFEK